jgi:hypothetical protein
MLWIGGHWLLNPLTFGILLLCGLLLAVRGLLRSTERSADAVGHVCPDESCGHENPANARYCAHCGRELPPHN